MENRLPPYKDLALKKDPLTLKKAKDILHAVVSVHESTITPNSPLEKLVEYGVHQIREAALVVCLDIIESREGVGKTQTRKRADNGFATLIIRRDEREMPETIGFYASIDSRPILGADFPLVDPKDDLGRRFVNFLDFDTGKLTMLDKSLDLYGYQHLFKGTRLMFANMLNWDKPNIISLEQFDYASLPKPPNPTIKSSFLNFFAPKRLK